MKIVFVSNYLNHHQIPFCQAVCNENNGDFTFIQMEPMDKERVSMGWGIDVSQYDFAKCYYDDPDGCQQIIDNSDVVIYGGVEDEKYIKNRLNKGSLVIRYSERIYKEGQWKFVSPRGLKKKYEDHTQYRKSNVYLLCAGGYVASDFKLIHAYPEKMFTWGYFPKIHKYNVDEVLEKKSKNEKLQLLWAGRMIDWKHPEFAISAANMLKSKGVDFHITMIGEGPLKGLLEENVKNSNLEGYVSFVGFLKPEQVREYMLSADIYMFTSDYLEGWGAVLNEAMNSCCAVVAGSGIGAVPSMMRHGYNGYVYKNKNEKEFLEYVQELAGNKILRDSFGKAAYTTVSTYWNPEYAGKVFVEFAKGLMEGNVKEYREGPLSKADIVSPGKGYKYTRR